MTPFEDWNQKKPSALYLCVFSCKAAFQRTKEKKLDCKARMYIFLGYGEQTKGYQLYDPVKQKVFFNWHVSFNEKCDLRKRLVSCLRLKLNLLLTHNLQFHLLQSNSLFDAQGERNIP